MSGQNRDSQHCLLPRFADYSGDGVERSKSNDASDDRPNASKRMRRLNSHTGILRDALRTPPKSLDLKTGTAVGATRVTGGQGQGSDDVGGPSDSGVGSNSSIGGSVSGSPAQTNHRPIHIPAASNVSSESRADAAMSADPDNPDPETIEST